MAGAGDEDDVGVAVADDPVEVKVEQVEPWRGAPVSEQSGFDVLGLQRFGQQGIVQQVDLAYGEVIGGPPVGIEAGQFIVGEGGR